MFLTVIIFFISVSIWSQNSSIVQQQTNNDGSRERPSVALVLAGGGARGFSHIPVIELIEELGIPIDMVIGTSAGAIIGGLYSAGYSGDEIAKELLYLDWPKLFQDATTQPLESALGNHSIEANLASIQLKRDLSLDLGKGLLTGQYVYNTLKSLTSKVPSYIHFDSLITPFRATAVDLLTGELVVIEQGDLAEAIRASMSIPAVFEPFPIDGRYYMDGFTRNNLPIQVAEDLGYDIVIAVEITDRLSSDVDTFDSNPLTTLNQVIALQQTVVVSEEYELADLIIYPDIYEFGQMDYDSALQIYEKGKKEAELYREDLIALRSRIYPNFGVEQNVELIEETQEFSENGYAFTFVTEDTSIPYERQHTYSELPSIYVENLTLKNVLPKDEKLIIGEFEEIRNAPVGQKEIDDLLSKAYMTGNYVLVTARLDKRVEGNTLELAFVQKMQKAVHLNTSGTFEGSISDSSTWALNLGTTLQFRDINDSGGVISLRGSYLNTTGLELMYMQPFSQKVFLQTKANVLNILDVVSSGFAKDNVSGSQLRHANISIACGVFFSDNHKLLNELGVRWVDSSLSSNDVIENTQGSDLSTAGYSFDISSRYTFSTLNYTLFPTKGFYNDLKLVGVIPLSDFSKPMIFDVISTDFLAAISLSDITTLAIQAFIGTNCTEALSSYPELITKYGFTTYDRIHFPHVMQRHTYGSHKIALKMDFQFYPKNQLTILGGQFFTGIGGSVGDVWDEYKSFMAFESIQWQSSVLAGLRIKDSIGVIMRAGAGSYSDGVKPFVSLDFMVKSY